MSFSHRVLVPSLLAGNHAYLARSAQESVDAGCRWLHIDIMDGHFVKNLTFGPQVVRDLRPEVPSLFFDAHLMLDEPHKYVDAFVDAGAQQILIHVEPVYPIAETLAHIRARGVACGIALNPDTPIESIKPYLSFVDTVLVMTVHPGFGGQSFRQDTLPKIKQVNDWRLEQGYGYRLEVDGGIDQSTWKECAELGADTFVVGNAFYKLDKNDRAKFRAAIETD
jgi:ribulose-phosphate 3-epimerase